MRKAKLFIAASLDGYIAGPDGRLDWLFHDADYGYREFYDSIDTVIAGRKTHDEMVRLGEPVCAGKRTVVATRRPPPPERAVPGVEYVSAAELPGFVDGLLASPGRDVWLIGAGNSRVGSSTAADSPS